MSILPDDIIQIILDCIEDQDEIIRVINTFDNFQQRSKFIYYTSNLIKNRIYLKEVEKFNASSTVWGGHGRTHVHKIFNHSGEIEGFESDFYKNSTIEKVKLNNRSVTNNKFNFSDFKEINPIVIKEIKKKINRYKKFL